MGNLIAEARAGSCGLEISSESGLTTVVPDIMWPGEMDWDGERRGQQSLGLKFPDENKGRAPVCPLGCLLLLTQESQLEVVWAGVGFHFMSQSNKLGVW